MVLFPGFDHLEGDNYGVDWVVHYQFEDIPPSQAIEEFRTLIQDLDERGLQTEVRHGRGASLLVFVKVPRELLGNEVYRSRVKDWLYGISHVRPVGDSNTIIDGETEAEELRSVYHLVTWQKQQGGAGVTANYGKWKNVKACFPLHNQSANKELLRRWSRAVILRAEDLDEIRALFGEKVAFYFAFIQAYSLFLTFPAVFGLFCWMYLGAYSITFALANCLWCVVFVEYWRLKETDLSIRWGVKGVGVLKVNRVQYKWEKEVLDRITGEVRKVFPARKQFLRQLLQLPFAIVASLALGTLIIITFAMEVVIGELYQGPFKFFLDFLPTILLSLLLPMITSFLTSIATQLTDYENYRTQDQYELAQTQKTLVLNFITSFLPIILTAFVYVPFGEKIVPYLDVFNLKGSKSSSFLWSDPVLKQQQPDFHVDPSRLQQEVIYLTVTGQVLGFCEEIILPYLKRVLLRMYRDYRSKRSEVAAEASAHRRKRAKSVALLLNDLPEEASFLERVRNESEADVYNVQEDLLEMCVQFGYLALFGVSWPLVPLGFLLNNWIELRGDFLKISLECQRPPPIRTDSIGPWLQGLEFLSWLGTLSSAALVHLYRSGSVRDVKLSRLLLTVFIAEQAYLATKFIVRSAFEKISSETIRREEARKYAVRKRYLETFNEEAAELSRRHKPRVRFNSTTNVIRESAEEYIDDKKKVYEVDDDDPQCTPRKPLCRTDSGRLIDPERTARFWSWQQTAQETIEAGIKLIETLAVASTNLSSEDNNKKPKKEA